MLIEAIHEVPSSRSAIALEQLGGATNRVADADTASGYRDASFNLLVVSSWPDTAEKTQNIQWTKTVWAAMQPFSTVGVDVNYLGEEADEGRDA